MKRFQTHNFDYYSKIYDKDYFNGRKSFFYKFGYKNFKNCFKKRLATILKFKRSGRFLDIGCALGFQLKVAQKYFDVYGFDASEYAIREAKKIVPNAKTIVHNAEDKFPYSSNYFDVIICFDVLEHVRSLEKVVLNVRRCLKNNGILFLSTPDKNFIRNILFHYPDKWEHHVSMLSKDSLIRLLTKCDFKVLKVWSGINLGNLQIWSKKIGLESLVICKKSR